MMNLLLAACLATSEAKVSPGSQFHLQPAIPHAGSLFRLALRGGEVNGKSNEVTATVSGEPLHFHVVGDSLVAIAAIPIDSTHGVNITLHCNNDAAITSRIRTQSGAYLLEKLTVAPQFSAPPDSALSARMSREAAQAAAVSRESHHTPRLWTAAFAKPRATRITSAFGGGRIFNGHVTSRHMGTDFAGTVGEPVRAANRGIVRLIGSFYLGGNVVYIDHGEGLVTAYLHLSKQLVAIGDTVEQGGIIGNVGATGRVTGPHLHFIARYGQITVDPLTLFDQR
ncbi:MAG: M23 family metallopeptidase [Gemmatimonadaceae bacterium]